MLLKEENILCISSIDWNFSWQGHQEIMSTLARNGNRVLFIENTGIRTPNIKDFPRIKERIMNWCKGIKGFRKQQENLYIYSPLILPFPYSMLLRGINKYLLLRPLERWMKTVNFSDPIIWTWLPTNISLDLMDNIPNKLVIYYCADNFAGIVNRPNKVRNAEKRLVNKTDIIFCTAEGLKKHCQKYRKWDKNSKNSISVFPYGVRLAKFENKQKQESSELTELPKPIIGFVGSVKRHIDFNLIEYIAKNNPEKSIVFIGYIEGQFQKQAARLKSFENVYFLGQKEHSDLAKYIRCIDICIIPYLLTEYTRTLYPGKLYEYLVMGKPVISTALPEIEHFNQRYGDIVTVAHSKEEFGEKIEEVLYNDRPEDKDKRIEAAQDNSWEKRIEEMSEIIQRAIDKKKLQRDKVWKENLLGFYRIARRRLARVGLICLSAYLLFFKTPFIWFVASPLKIVNEPQKADAIVVFGGGVGETGSPGKSTIERARYAVEFYKQGYAKKIIFSSGYTFRYNDAENMKLFALSMGVPEKNIILEQKANSTYENVKFTEEIVDREGWDTVLLVTSPYNMLRTFLVFRKLADRPEIIYTPVPEPQFYDRNVGSKWQQIRAILHEYLGIIYYWWKGYI